jgi:hypothetical protein
MYANVAANHASMNTAALYLWNNAWGYANAQVTEAAYLAAVTSFKGTEGLNTSGSDHNFWVVARLNGQEEFDQNSVVGIAALLQNNNPNNQLNILGDSFANKGLQLMLQKFNEIIVEEGEFVDELLGYLAYLGVNNGDPVTNLGLAQQKLQRAFDGLAEVLT